MASSSTHLSSAPTIFSPSGFSLEYTYLKIDIFVCDHAVHIKWFILGRMPAWKWSNGGIYKYVSLSIVTGVPNSPVFVPTPSRSARSTHAGQPSVDARGQLGDHRRNVCPLKSVPVSQLSRAQICARNCEYNDHFNFCAAWGKTSIIKGKRDPVVVGMILYP